MESSAERELKIVSAIAVATNLILAVIKVSIGLIFKSMADLLMVLILQRIYSRLRQCLYQL
ncbi:MAG: hypothetical protein ABDH59_05740 [Fervidobacterium sp.]